MIPTFAGKNKVALGVKTVPTDKLVMLWAQEFRAKKNCKIIKDFLIFILACLSLTNLTL